MGLLPQGPDQQGPDLGLGPKNQSFNRGRSCPSLINPELSATLGTVVCMVDHSLGGWALYVVWSPAPTCPSQSSPCPPWHSLAKLKQAPAQTSTNWLHFGGNLPLLTWACSNVSQGKKQSRSLGCLVPSPKTHWIQQMAFPSSSFLLF